MISSSANMNKTLQNVPFALYFDEKSKNLLFSLHFASPTNEKKNEPMLLLGRTKVVDLMANKNSIENQYNLKKKMQPTQKKRPNKKATN